MRVEVKNVSKIIDKNTVLKDINLGFCEGNIYGIVGRKGSGKAMLLRILAGLVYPSTGSVTVDGMVLHKDISSVPNLGVFIEEPVFFDHLPGLENLKSLAGAHAVVSVKKMKAYMRMFSLNPDSKQLVKMYSMGMKQKLGIIQAIMSEPKYLILDEPFNTLDAEAVITLKSLLLRYKEVGRLVIITSRHKADISSICDVMIRLDAGRQVEQYDKMEAAWDMLI